MNLKLIQMDLRLLDQKRPQLLNIDLKNIMKITMKIGHIKKAEVDIEEIEVGNLNLMAREKMQTLKKKRM